MERERRREPRFPVTSSIRVIVPGHPARTLDSRLIDISATGLRFLSNEKMPSEGLLGIEVDSRLILAEIRSCETRGDKYVLGVKRLHEIAKDSQLGDAEGVVAEMLSDFRRHITDGGKADTAALALKAMEQIVERSESGSGAPIEKAAEVSPEPVSVPAPVIVPETIAEPGPLAPAIVQPVSVTPRAPAMGTSVIEPERIEPEHEIPAPPIMELNTLAIEPVDDGAEKPTQVEQPQPSPNIDGAVEAAKAETPGLGSPEVASPGAEPPKIDPLEAARSWAARAYSEDLIPVPGDPDGELEEGADFPEPEEWGAEPKIAAVAPPPLPVTPRAANARYQLPEPEEWGDETAPTVSKFPAPNPLHGPGAEIDPLDAARTSSAEAFAEMQQPKETARPQTNWALLGTIAAAMMIAVIVVSLLVQRHTQAQTTPTRVAPVVSAPTAPTSPKTLQKASIHIGKSTFVSIIADGQETFTGILQDDERKEFTFVESASVFVNQGEQGELWLNETRVPTPPGSHRFRLSSKGIELHD
jgi:hypothetical protein